MHQLRSAHLLFALAAAAAPAAAQHLCEGNGLGQAYITTTPARIGDRLLITLGSPAAPNGLGVLSLSGSFGPSTHPHPLIGTTCLDVFNGAYGVLLAFLDGAGHSVFDIAIANVPATFGYAPLFASALTLEGGIFSISKTVRIQWEHVDAWRELPAMNEMRSMHTATAFEATPRDNRTGVLVAGGGQGYLLAPVPSRRTQVFDSLTRTWSAGPDMAVPRTMHRAVRLVDGRILITGGMVQGPTLGGPATNHCEIFDPATGAFTPTGGMLQGRLGHGLSLLPDGRVLATGGFADWSDAGPNFQARLNTVQITTEIYDPATGVWTGGPTMASRRAGHSQTLLPDGRTLIVGGCNGGTTILAGGLQPIQVPTFTSSVQSFLSPSATLQNEAPLTLARGFHGASLLRNGDLLVTGGAALVGFNGEAAATNTCARFDGTVWHGAAPIGPAVAFHTQVASPRTGDAILIGGYVGNFVDLTSTTTAAIHTGAAVTLLASVGHNAGVPGQTGPTIASHSCTVLHDGTLLVTGGAGLWSPLAPTLTNRAFLYIER